MASNPFPKIKAPKAPPRASKPPPAPGKSVLPKMAKGAAAAAELPADMPLKRGGRVGKC